MFSARYRGSSQSSLDEYQKQLELQNFLPCWSATLPSTFGGRVRVNITIHQRDNFRLFTVFFPLLMPTISYYSATDLWIVSSGIADVMLARITKPDIGDTTPRAVLRNSDCEAEIPASVPSDLAFMPRMTRCDTARDYPQRSLLNNRIIVGIKSGTNAR